MHGYSERLEQLLEAIAKTLVDHPEEVKVRSIEGETRIILELRVDPEDVGQVIGHHGRIVEALRTIFRGAGMKRLKRVTVEILT